MDIALDANILISDIWLRSQNMRVLFDYLAKTQSHVLISEVVVAEIKQHVKRQFMKSIASIDSALSSGKRLGIIGISDFSCDQLLQSTFEEWERNFNQALNAGTTIRIPLNNNVLDEVIKRATERGKPCSESGEGVRDAIIWLNLLAFRTSTARDHAIAFVSQNTSDFAAPDKKSLHPELAKDAEQHGVNILYYAALDVFLKEHAEPISHITSAWVREHLNLSEVEATICAHLDAGHAAEKFRIYEGKYRERYEPSGRPENIAISDIELDDVHVWEFDDQHIEAVLSLHAYIEAEFDCERISSHRSYSYEDEDYDNFSWNVRTLTCYAELGFEISVEIIGNTLTLLLVEDTYRY
jgi:hypothetical protein